MNTSTRDSVSQWQTVMAAGVQCAQRGDLNGAMQAFDTAVKVAPERIEGWINLGSIMLESQHLKAAVNVLVEALKREPENMLALITMGDAQRLLNRRDLARKAYEKAVAAERAPEALNRLACFIRHLGEHEEALALYNEALEKNPSFSLAKVNRATLHLSMARYSEAEKLLDALSSEQLPPLEAQEVASALTAISEYHRLGDLIDTLEEFSDLAHLESALRKLPAGAQRVDNKALSTITAYMKATQKLSPQTRPLDIELPQDWPMIEALHMVPYVNSVDEYLAFIANPPAHDISYDLKLHQSINMEAAVNACRAAQGHVSDPVRLEAHLRHWHRLACDKVAGFQPGHFKYTNNVDLRNPTLPLADPAAASNTFRIAAEQAYLQTDAGIERATIAFLVVADLHLFGDGNGRVGMTWLNRVLEWAGEMPALFSADLGPNGMMGDALYEVRTNGGDLSPMYDCINAAQDHAREFLLELSQKR